MSRREYRVTKVTHGDDSVSFEVDFRSNPNAHWLQACTRATLELAKIAIVSMKSGEVVNKEVVHAE